MKHIEYLVEYANGEEEIIKASGLMACIVKATVNRTHLANPLPIRIKDKDSGNEYTNIRINWNKL